VNGVAQPAPSFAEAFRVWVKIGLLSFGGPAGQIALTHRILVDEKRWISEPQFLHALNYCMLLPGPEAQQLATYVGWLLHRTKGALAAGLLFILPGFAVIIGLSLIYALFHETRWLDTLFFGLKAAVLAIVVQALIRIGRRALKNRLMLAFALAAFVALFVFHVAFPYVVLIAGLAGLLGARVAPKLLTGSSHGAGRLDEGDVLPLRPGEAGWPRALRVLIVCALVWLSLPAILIGAFGWESVYAPIAGFFSKMAVVTFGGAYAVLSYVAQEAVTTYGWLSPGEMLDGLAMAETTPGPLIMVLSYVGFLAGFRDPTGLGGIAGGLLGGLLATWVTFAPCFLWILVGAPYVERLRGNRALSAGLGAITAAVVGVIANLALWFALHVLFGAHLTHRAGPVELDLPIAASVDYGAVILVVAALIGVLGLKAPIWLTLLACAAGGAALRQVL
jgi:chromate transporter